MDRQKHRPSRGRIGAQRVGHLAALTQVEAVERLVREQQGLRHQQADGEQRALALAFGQAADRRIEEPLETEPADHFVAQIRTAAKQSEGEIDRPANRLRGQGTIESGR